MRVAGRAEHAEQNKITLSCKEFSLSVYALTLLSVCFSLARVCARVLFLRFLGIPSCLPRDLEGLAGMPRGIEAAALLRTATGQFVGAGVGVGVGGGSGKERLAVVPV